MDRSDGNGIPLINVKFPNGHEDTMHLERYFSSPEDRNSNNCNFIGHLVNDQSACVAITGCYDSEDLEMTIMSRNVWPTRMFKLTKDGIVIPVESAFKVRDR